MRVLLADDHTLFRAGIASLLQVWGLEVVGEAADGVEACDQARRLRPDLVLMDVGMPERNGLEATRVIKDELPETRVVMVTMSDENDDLFEAIKSGAEGYLLKDATEAELSETLSKLAAGEPALSPRLAAKILDEFARVSRGTPEPKAEGDDLSTRERDVLGLLAQGLTNREIAAELVVSTNTVEFHVRNILTKLHLANRTQAAAYAIRRGLADPQP